MGEGEEVEKHKCEDGSRESNREEAEENILNFLDSMDSYLVLINHLSSILRQGWLELASARHSMGASRVSSALFDLKYHDAATTLLLNQDAGSSREQPSFTLCKWESDSEEKGNPGEPCDDEDKLLESTSRTTQIRHRGPSQNTDFEEQKAETNHSSLCGDKQAQKERLKSLSMFGALVSPKLRAAQVSFETALDMLVETANTRASLLCTYDELRKGTERTNT